MQPAISKKLATVEFDLIVFTSTLVDSRWLGKDGFKKRVTDHLQFIKESKAVKVAHPQDEWIFTNILNDFINEFEIDYVFTVAPQSEWKKIYNKVDFDRVKFHGVLTGYIDENTFKKLSSYTTSGAKRNIDIGYRAFRAPAWQIGRAHV